MNWHFRSIIEIILNSTNPKRYWYLCLLYTSIRITEKNASRFRLLAEDEHCLLYTSGNANVTQDRAHHLMLWKHLAKGYGTINNQSAAHWWNKKIKKVKYDKRRQRHPEQRVGIFSGIFHKEGKDVYKRQASWIEMRKVISYICMV